MKKGGESKISFLLPQGFESFPLDLPEARWCNLVLILMLLWVLNVGFENTCTVSGKCNVFRVTPKLYRWVYKTVHISGRT